MTNWPWKGRWRRGPEAGLEAVSKGSCWSGHWFEHRPLWNSLLNKWQICCWHGQWIYFCYCSTFDPVWQNKYSNFMEQNFFSRLKYGCWKKQRKSCDLSKKPSFLRIRSEKSILIWHVFMALWVAFCTPPAWPSPLKCLCVWAALGGCHDSDIYPQSCTSKSNFCANHRGLIKILIETKHEWQLPQSYEPPAKSVYICGLQRSYFYRALKSW